MEEYLPPQPGRLVILIPLSAGMGTDAPTVLGPVRKDVGAQFFTDELLEALVDLTINGQNPFDLEVAVIGYRTPEGGSPLLTSLLPDGETAPHLVSLSTLASTEVEARSPGRPKHWTNLPDLEGTAPADAALAEAYRLIVAWMGGRHRARAPVVVHCTDGEGIGPSYERIARSLNLLSTSEGPPKLAVCGLVSDWPTATGPVDWGDGPPEPWSIAWPYCSELPGGRTLSVNDWPMNMIWELLFGETVVHSAGADNPLIDEPFDLTRTFWTAKLGNNASEWEDAFAVDPKAGAATVCDGASEGIFCRVWANMLAERATAAPPDFKAQRGFSQWVNGCRVGWREAIKYEQLRWSQQSRVDSVGAAATLLVLRIGPANESGERPWTAAGVGDACMFQVRGDRLLTSFPIVAKNQFGSAPFLVRSDPTHNAAPALARGTCLPGDLFLLATDAVAGHLFRDPDGFTEWRRFEDLEEEAWLHDMEIVRKEGEMVNDDCTLVALRVAGGSRVEG